MTDWRVSTPRALAGLAVAAAVLAATVAGLHALVDQGEQVAPIDAPVPAADRCAGVRAPGNSAVPVTAAQLVECPHEYDGATVRYRGEVVRAVLLRGERAIVQVNDDRYALELGPLPEHRTAVGGNSGIPVVLPRRDADAIAYVGDYRHRGDVLQVAGTFRAADPYDGGGPTITAASVALERPGGPLEHRADGLRILVAAMLAAITVGMAVANVLVNRE